MLEVGQIDKNSILDIDYVVLELLLSVRLED